MIRCWHLWKIKHKILIAWIPNIVQVSLYHWLGVLPDIEDSIFCFGHDVVLPIVSAIYHVIV